ncbi:MAG: BTAD domain-containing putative transcriptional regulator [Actinomycetota bacterium]
MAHQTLLVRALGPVTLSYDRRDAPVLTAQVRTTLAVLLTKLGEIVPTDMLIDCVWEGFPPRSARHGLHVIMSHLRSELEPDGSDSPKHLESRSPGYRLDLGIDEFDVRIVEDLVHMGRECREAQELDEAEALLIAAEAMCHGRPYAEFTYAEFAQPEIRRLTELCISAVEDRIAVQLDLGRHRDLIPELEGLTMEHPTRESLLFQLMTALYRCDRPADAIVEFESARRRLRDDYGSEPSRSTTALADTIRRSA